MNQIICALIERHAIGSDNVITASYTVKDNVGRIFQKIGNFGVVSYERIDDEIKFRLQHLVEKNQIYINDEAILAIDGMDIKRYADVYDINADGSNKKTGKKRGRKPKST